MKRYRHSAFVTVLAVFILSVWLLAGCKPGDPAGETPATPPLANEPQAAKQQKITVLTNRVDLVENGVFRKYADRFQKVYPDPA